jgi:hypothetical protein
VCACARGTVHPSRVLHTCEVRVDRALYICGPIRSKGQRLKQAEIKERPGSSAAHRRASTLCAGTGAQPRRGATAQQGQAQVYTGPAVRVARLLRPRVALGERATIWFPNARMNSSQTNKRFA